jgi:hypothetical protein
MPEEPVILNWDRIVHKNVRSKDMQDVGTIIAILGDAITILQGTTREYQVPKSHVEGFNGSEVLLDLPFNDVVKSYKIA